LTVPRPADTLGDMDELAKRNTPAAELPALIAGAGEKGAWRFVEFFTVNIRNRNTRAAYSRAAAVFLRWCEAQGIRSLAAVQPVHVAAYIYVEELQRRLSVPTVGADGQATFSLYPHALRLARDGSNRPGEPRARGNVVATVNACFDGTSPV
jgi:hypothetical protein